MNGSDALASAAVDRFCLSLGAVAGDLALAQGAKAVVIAGGLGLRIKERLVRSGFAERFVAKGRFESLMRNISVKLISHPQPGLFGGAAAFAKTYGVARLNSLKSDCASKLQFLPYVPEGDKRVGILLYHHHGLRL